MAVQGESGVLAGRASVGEWACAVPGRSSLRTHLGRKAEGGGDTTAPVNPSSAQGWGGAGKEGGRPQEEEESQGRTTGNGEGGNACEHH